MYKGQSISSLPDNYLSWLLGVAYEPLLSAVEQEVRRRDFCQAKPQPSTSLPVTMAQRIITSGFRQLAMELHPDHGGDHEQMQQLNAAHTWLRDRLLVLR